MSRAQADAELRVIAARAAASLPATHEHLRPRVTRLGTLVYAKMATRGEKGSAL